MCYRLWFISRYRICSPTKGSLSHSKNKQLLHCDICRNKLYLSIAMIQDLDPHSVGCYIFHTCLCMGYSGHGPMQTKKSFVCWSFCLHFREHHISKLMLEKRCTQLWTSWKKKRPHILMHFIRANIICYLNNKNCLNFLLENNV